LERVHDPWRGCMILGEECMILGEECMILGEGA